MNTQDILGNPESKPYTQENTNIPILNEGSDIEIGYSEKWNQRLRIGFIRKVYGILSLQLLITAIFVGMTFFREVKYFMYENIGLFYGAMGLSLIIVFSLLCFPTMFRVFPTNYIILFVWTVCEAYMVGTASAFNPPEIVLTAASLTALVTISLTLYAFTTKTDFTFLGGFLFVATTIMLFWGIFYLIFGFFLYTVYCVIGVILYSIYLIFDTQLILGKFGLEYSIDDYILAALSVYIDIIQLFMFFLQLLRGTRD
jgi:FtsH-binding integral membrane protein